MTLPVSSRRSSAGRPGTPGGCLACPLGRASLPALCPFRDVAHAPGDVLILQGELPSSVLFVKSGAVLVTSVVPSGDEAYCAVRGAGSLLGLELLGGGVAEYQAWALSASVVCRLAASAFRLWLGDLDSPMGAVLKLALGEAERRLEDRVALVGSAVARLARFLMEHRRVEGHDSPLALQHQVLARMLAMRPETLSRALATLRSRGAIEGGRSLRVIDPERLAEVAGDIG